MTLVLPGGALDALVVHLQIFPVAIWVRVESLLVNNTNLCPIWHH